MLHMLLALWDTFVSSEMRSQLTWHSNTQTVKKCWEGAQQWTKPGKDGKTWSTTPLLLSFITCFHRENGTKLKPFVPAAELFASVPPLHQESGTSEVSCGLICPKVVLLLKAGEPRVSEWNVQWRLSCLLWAKCVALRCLKLPQVQSVVEIRRLPSVVHFIIMTPTSVTCKRTF